MSKTALNGSNGHAKRIPQGILFDAGGKIVTSTAQKVFQNTGYSNYGANFTKNSMAGWMHHGGDADADIGANVQTLRERSRDAFMGIPLAAGAVETLVTSVIGEGLFPSPNVDGEALGLSEDETRALNAELADKFRYWAMSPRECDFEGRNTFYTLQGLAFQSMLLSGDCPVLLPLKSGTDSLFELRVRVIEADRVMDPPNYAWKPGQNIYSGVELSPEGELVAYHISKFHPLSLRRFNVKVPMGETIKVTPFGALTGRRNMLLMMRPERPEQRRGVPILSVCLELLKQMGRYIDSTVVSAVIQSYFTAFITSEFPDENIMDSLLTEQQKAEICALNPYNVQLGPGIVNFMKPGHEVNFATPSQPQATFGDFTIAVAKFVGAALGTPYEVILKQYNASYSASRAALLDFWKRVRKHRALVIDQFSQPIYEEWVTDAVSLSRIERFSGDLKNPLVRHALMRCIWTGNSAGSLDPAKEVQAADLKVKCGFSTTEREASELNGSNYRDNIRQQATERQEFEDNDLVYPPYRPTTVAGNTQGGNAAPSKKGFAKIRRHDISAGLSGEFIR